MELHREARRRKAAKECEAMMRERGGREQERREEQTAFTMIFSSVLFAAVLAMLWCVLSGHAIVTELVREWDVWKKAEAKPSPREFEELQ